VRDYPGIRSNTTLPGFVDTPIFKAHGLNGAQIEAVFTQIGRHGAVWAGMYAAGDRSLRAVFELAGCLLYKWGSNCRRRRLVVVYKLGDLLFAAWRTRIYVSIR
jgi:NAD(P)-dependent dehydrogenase (short-subunit alcohol dehydrogenase family)